LVFKPMASKNRTGATENRHGKHFLLLDALSRS
jgi:hypothetical protein